MAKGLALPVGVNSRGGSRTTEGDDQAKKVIAVALDEDDNDNPFQQNDGLGSSMIFSINDPSVRAKIMNRLVKAFSEFEKLDLYKLVVESVKWQEDVENQELGLKFNWINLETDEVKDFEKRFSGGKQ